MTYKYFAGVYLAAALYSENLERQCRLPNGAWSCEAGKTLTDELTRNTEDALRCDMAALLHIRAIAGLVAQAPKDCLRPEARLYMADLLKHAKRVTENYHHLFHRNRELEPTMSSLAERFAADIEQLKDAGA